MQSPLKLSLRVRQDDTSLELKCRYRATNISYGLTKDISISIVLFLRLYL